MFSQDKGVSNWWQDKGYQKPPSKMSSSLNKKNAPPERQYSN